jgi:hypothetical protein
MAAIAGGLVTGLFAIGERALVPFTDKNYEAKILKAEFRCARRRGGLRDGPPTACSLPFGAALMQRRGRYSEGGVPHSCRTGGGGGQPISLPPLTAPGVLIPTPNH